MITKVYDNFKLPIQYNKESREILCTNAIKKSKNFDINNTENREKEIYQELIDSNNTRI